MSGTPNAERLRIVLVGIRNAGKSSLMNRLFDREVSIISDTPGTTTDPVTRAMELGPLGPVMLTDTAGLDDEGELGVRRIDQSLKRTAAADAILFVTPAHKAPASEERELMKKLRGRAAEKGNDGESEVPVRFVVTYGDRRMDREKMAWLQEVNSPVRASSVRDSAEADAAAGVSPLAVSAEEGSTAVVDNMTGEGISELLEGLHSLRDTVKREISPLEGIVSPGDVVLLVTPIDSAAPKGRLILPQVETLRDALDRDCAAMVAKEHELRSFYDRLAVRPKLVITDSQAFHQVAASIPTDQALTSFSILFARKKGDLSQLIRGIQHLQSVPPGGRVLVMESCSHHRQEDDIGTVKIPRLFRRHLQADVEFGFARSLPPEEELMGYDLIIHCAACMNTRRFIMNRLAFFDRLNIPVTNYGLFLGWVNGLLPRALEPFSLFTG